MLNYSLIRVLIVIGLSIVVIYSAPAAKVDKKSVKLLSYKNEPHGVSNKYSFGYKTSDGQERNEEGHFIPDKNGTIKHVVNGSYRHVAPNGNIYMVSYTADENGYHPETMIIVPSKAVMLGLSPNAVKSLIG